jgi:dolichol-phosphate mannosyltransferase
MDLSIVIPTYNEKENISILVKSLKNEFKKNKINGEIIIVDDNSPDGTGSLIDKLSKKDNNLKIIHRVGKLGLSSAVLEGFKIARGDVFGVMDADLSHPYSKINELYSTIRNSEADLVIGSRYVLGGNIVGWNNYRKILSKGATLLARLFTKIKDPMSGFFMIKKECLNEVKIDSKGFKILLEIIIKSNYSSVKEIPITFTNRIKGKSKAGMKEILFYIRNLLGYAFSDKHLTKEFLKFSFVGLISIFVSLIVLYSFTEIFGVSYLISQLIAIGCSLILNFVGNKIWTFSN